MSGMQVREIPLVFECEGDALVGIVHKPEIPREIAVLSIIAGGPQYRAGVGRGMVSLARKLSANGVAVLRFDHRGLGDGAGQFRGFEDMAADIQAAVDAFRAEVPEVKKVVLWGGCDAASSAMIHGWKIPDAASLVLGNPWVTTTEIQEAVMRQHYRSRLLERSFWRKVLRFEYNLLEYARAGFQKVSSGLKRSLSNTESDDPLDTGHFVDRMLDGLRRFDGPVLFLMSGQSLITQEFDELVSRDDGWREVYNRPGSKRVDLPNADQTFSDEDSRERVNRAICDWVDELIAS